MLGAGQPMLAMDPEEVGHNTPPPDWLLWSAAEMNQLQLGTSPAIAALALVPAVPHFLKAAGIQLSLGDGATEENLNWPDQICSPSPPVLEDPLDQIRSASPPAPEKRRPPINLENPFDENYPERHTMNRTQVLQLEGDVDSYVKFRVRVRNVDRHGTQASLSRRRFKPGRHQRHNIFRRSSPPFDCILRPPPNLGWGATPPSEKDREVFRFCKDHGLPSSGTVFGALHLRGKQTSKPGAQVGPCCRRQTSGRQRLFRWRSPGRKCFGMLFVRCPVGISLTTFRRARTRTTCVNARIHTIEERRNLSRQLSTNLMTKLSTPPLLLSSSFLPTMYADPRWCFCPQAVMRSAPPTYLPTYPTLPDFVSY